MKPFTELTLQDRLQLLFDLFPNELSPFIVYVLDASSAVRRTEILTKLVWNNKSMDYLEFRTMVNQIETSLFRYMDSKIDSPAQLCQILGDPDVFYWTQKCLLGYLCLENDLKFTLAHELFFNPNPPQQTLTDYYQLLNN